MKQRHYLLVSLLAAAAMTACGQKAEAPAASAAKPAASAAASAAAPASVAAPAASAAAPASAAVATASAAKPAAAPVAASAAKTAAPAAAASAAKPANQAAANAGESVYKATCQACHASGVAGAPKFGDKAAWGPRVAQGKDTLYKHAIEGFSGKAGVMPPKGGAAASDADVKAAVDYMVAQAH